MFHVEQYEKLDIEQVSVMFHVEHWEIIFWVNQESNCSTWNNRYDALYVISTINVPRGTSYYAGWLLNLRVFQNILIKSLCDKKIFYGLHKVINAKYLVSGTVVLDMFHVEQFAMLYFNTWYFRISIVLFHVEHRESADTRIDLLKCSTWNNCISTCIIYWQNINNVSL